MKNKQNKQKKLELIESELDYKKIGMRIRSYRKALGLSQEKLAEMIDISTTHISHIETGSTKLSLPVLVNIAESLSVQTDQLLYDYPVQNPTRTISKISEKLESCSDKELPLISDILSATIDSLHKNQIL